MKKIIATVLAMVMALALCTTAFADIPLWTTNGSTANVDLFDGKFNTKVAEGSMSFTSAVAPTVDSNGKVTAPGHVAYYTFTNSSETSTDCNGKYILVSSIPADATASDYVLVKTSDKTVAVGAQVEASQTAASQRLIMKKVDAVTYYYTATEFTAWGDLCGQYKKPANADTVTYFSYTDNTAARIGAANATALEDSTDNVLFKGEVLTIRQDTFQTAKQHSWAASAWDKKGVATEYTCATCKTVAKVINASVNAPAGSTVEKLADGTLIAFTYTPGTANNTNNGSASSPKTFDAGIAMYVGMALTSVAGSAVVIGKKKEF